MRNDQVIAMHNTSLYIQVQVLATFSKKENKIFNGLE